MLDRRSLPYWVTVFITLASAMILFAMGRAPIYAGGHVLLWYGPVGTPEANMHLFDWYSPSHLIHGFAFYGALFVVARRLALGWRLALSTLVEAGWEVLENTNAMIERYRSTTMSTEYIGDSVINSTFDILAMIVGFYLALRLPIWLGVAICLGFEVLSALVIRDGLLLNIVMLLWPVEAIVEWQTGG